MSLTVTYANQEWTLVGLAREQDAYMGSGWVAEFSAEGEHSTEPDGLIAHRLDHDTDGMWIIHFLSRGWRVQFSHGFGSMGIELAPVLPRPLAELIETVLAAGFKDGDDASAWGMGRLLPAMLEQGGQLRLDMEATR
jgi:hypothetical protein